MSHFPLPSRSLPNLYLTTRSSNILANSLVVTLAVKDTQDGEEQVEDVQVQADGGGDLLLDVVLAHDELGIDKDVAGEDERGEAAIDQLAGAAIRQEGGHESEQDEAPQRAE